MTTLAQLKTWLKTPSHIRRVLIEIDNVTDLSGGNSATYYFSNGAYTSSSTDTPANKNYLPYVIGGVSFTETFSINGDLTTSYGDIELLNTDGILDSYLNLIWAKKEIRIYLGDPSWAKTDFKLLFKGMVADISTRDRSTINIILTDKLQALATAISETTITNQDSQTPQLVPLIFGECFNITPLLTNKSTLEYQVHTGTIEDIIEVRDNGAPVSSFTKDLTNGKFTLNQAAYGQITCSVQGDKSGGVYSNKIAQIIKNIVTNYGPASNRLTTSDIATNFTDFDITYSRSVGSYISDRQNILEVCNELASSANAKLMFTVGPLTNDSDVGKLQLAKLKANSTATYTIMGSDIEENSISLSEKIPVKAATKIAYCKNWTPQTSGLATGLPPEHVSFFNNPWLYTPDNTITATKTNYKLTSEVIQEDTLIINKSSAVQEATERLTLWSTPRYVYTMTGYPYLFDLQLGDAVSLTNRRFNLNAKVGTVISISRDWLKGRVEIGVLV
jgi:hypothetical protein